MLSSQKWTFQTISTVERTLCGQESRSSHPWYMNNRSNRSKNKRCGAGLKIFKVKAPVKHYVQKGKLHRATQHNLHGSQLSKWFGLTSSWLHDFKMISRRGRGCLTTDKLITELAWFLDCERGNCKTSTQCSSGYDVTNQRYNLRDVDDDDGPCGQNTVWWLNIFVMIRDEVTH